MYTEEFFKAQFLLLAFAERFNVNILESMKLSLHLCRKARYEYKRRMKHWTFIVISSHFAGKAGTNKTGDPKESDVRGITTAQPTEVV